MLERRDANGEGTHVQFNTGTQQKYANFYEHLWMGRKLYTPFFGHIHLRGSSRVPSDLGRQPQKSERNSGVAAPNGRTTGMADAPSRRVPHSPKCTVPTVSNCNPFDHEHRLTFPFCRGATQCHLDDFARQTARPGTAGDYQAYQLGGGARGLRLRYGAAQRRRCVRVSVRARRSLTHSFPFSSRAMRFRCQVVCDVCTYVQCRITLCLDFFMSVLWSV